MVVVGGTKKQQHLLDVVEKNNEPGTLIKLNPTQTIASAMEFVRESVS